MAGGVWLGLESFCSVLYCRVTQTRSKDILDISRTNSFRFQFINICYQKFSSSNVYHYTSAFIHLTSSPIKWEISALESPFWSTIKMFVLSAWGPRLEDWNDEMEPYNVFSFHASIFPVMSRLPLPRRGSDYRHHHHRQPPSQCSLRGNGHKLSSLGYG